MKKIDLVKQAVREWAEGSLVSEEAMWAILAITFSEAPSQDFMIWAEKSMLREEKDEQLK